MSNIKSKEKKTSIRADAAKCAGCMMCMLSCSLWHEKAFKMGASSITISRLVQQDREFDISFSPECNSCGICTRYCTYGALVLEKPGQGDLK